MQITQEQIKKLNERCENDFKFDVENYLRHKEKQLLKYIFKVHDKKLTSKINILFSGD